MRRCFIETSVIIDYLRGKKETIAFVDGLEVEIFSSYFCLTELYEGIARVKENKAAENAHSIFFRIRWGFGIDENIAKTFGKLRSGLKLQGKIIEDIDLFLAATCLAHNLVLVTANPKHFSRVQGLDFYRLIKSQKKAFSH